MGSFKIWESIGTSVLDDAAAGSLTHREREAVIAGSEEADEVEDEAYAGAAWQTGADQGSSNAVMVEDFTLGLGRGDMDGSMDPGAVSGGVDFDRALAACQEALA